MLNETSRDFIEAANEDLRVMEESRYFGFRSANSACFHAQQYAEKMIKARMIELGFKVERSHNLLFLLDDFDNTPDIECARSYCEILSRYEARARYPMDGLTRFSPEEAEEAYEMTKKIPELIGLHVEHIPDIQKDPIDRYRLSLHIYSYSSYFKLHPFTLETGYFSAFFNNFDLIPDERSISLTCAKRRMK